MTDIGQHRDSAQEAEWQAAAEGAPAPTRTQNFIARAVRIVALMLPYTLVALVLRLVMARAFFVAGQAKVDGPVIPIVIPGLDRPVASVTLPMSLKDGAYQMFDQLAALPLPSWIAAPVVGAIEFIVPICLVLGFGTRFCAIMLLVMTAVIQWVTGGAAFWSLHIYWISILLVLISLGPGRISVDHLMRYLYEK
jgi:putative oxidoreductase